jgi:hypothetical protein
MIKLDRQFLADLGLESVTTSTPDADCVSIHASSLSS